MYYFKSTKAFTIVELMIVIAILSILLAIAIPNFISYRHKSFCSQAESDANSVAAAVADYFGTPVRNKTPNFDDLNLTLTNHVEILGADPNVCVTILVTDSSGRCPLDYQLSRPGWSSNIFTLEMSVIH